MSDLHFISEEQRLEEVKKLAHGHPAENDRPRILIISIWRQGMLLTLAYILKLNRGGREKFKKVQRKILELLILEETLDILNVKTGRKFRT